MKKQQETHPCARCGKPARKGYRYCYCYYCYLEVCDEMVASRYFTRHPAIEAPREQPASDERICPRCHGTFRVTEATACFLTCPKCRRPDKGGKRRKIKEWPENDGFGTAGRWDAGGNEWDDAIRTIEDH